MANLSHFHLSLLLFSFLFAVSEARIAFPEFGFNKHRDSGDAVEPSIRLPSEKIRPDHENPGVSGSASAASAVTTKGDELATVPLTLLNFHPINRRFAHARRFPIRIPHRCRHHRRRPTITRVSAFKYDNDMVLPSDFYGDILTVPVAEGQEMPDYYPNHDHRHHHHQHHNHLDDDGVVQGRSAVYRGHFPNRFYHRFDLKDEPREEPKENRKERDDNVVVKSIRKFLGQF